MNENGMNLRVSRDLRIPTKRWTDTARRTAARLVTVSALLTIVSCSSGEDTGSVAETAEIEPGTLRVSELQLIGSHNSYHVAQSDEQIAAMAKAVEDLNLDVGDPRSLAYTHAPLDEQLDSGVRSFELDVNAPSGAAGAEIAVVEHITALDSASTCPDLAACLEAIETWMDANPGHVPIPVLIELKADFTVEQLEVLDRIIREAVDADRLFEPDDLRGSAATLKSVVEERGWPKLSEMPDSMFMLMDNGGVNSERYRQGHEDLSGRVLFTTDGLGEDGTLRGDAAALKMNDTGDGKEIAEMVERGYFVRTRADADLVEAKGNDPARRDAAFESGAQIVSTDYPPGEPRADNGYQVTFGGDAPGVRCNPVTAPDECPSSIET